MRSKSLLAIACLVALSCTGCADSPDAIAQDAVNTSKELTATLKTVTDEASAKAAAPKLKSIGAQMQKINDRMKALKPDQQQVLAQKLAAQMGEAMAMIPEVMRVGTLNIQDKDFQDAMKSTEMKSPLQ